MDQYGAAFVLLTGFSQMAATQRPAGGDFTEPVTLPWLHASRSGLHNALPMYDAAGRLLVTWGDSESGDLRYAVRDPVTGAGYIDTLVESERNPDAFGPAMAADGGGTVYFGWRENRLNEKGECCYGYNGPFIATMEDGQAFGPARQIAAHTGVDQRMDLDASTTGAAAIVWPDVSGPGSGYMTSVQPVGGDFGPPERIPGVVAGIDSGSPKVSIDDAGTALFAIKSIEGRGAMQEPAARVVVTMRHPDGTFTDPAIISTSDQASDPAIAAGPSGEAVLAWAEGEYEDARLLVSVRRPDGSFTEPSTLATGLRRIEPQIGMDAVGNAIVTWAAHNSDGWRIYAAHRPPLGAFGQAQPISEPRVVPEGSGTYPRLAVGGPGNAIVTWDGNPDGQGPRVEAAVFDIVAPLVPDFDVAAGARQDAAAAAARTRRKRRRIAFHWYVTEQSQVAIQLRRHGITVRTVRASATSGVNDLSVRGRKLKAGRYRAVLRATDGLGHESKPRRARFRLRRR